MFGFTFKTLRLYLIVFIMLLFAISSDYQGSSTYALFNEELEDLCLIFSHSAKEILLRLNRIADFIKPVLTAATVVDLDKAIMLPIVRLVFLVTGSGKYLILLLLAGFVLGRILRFQAIENFKTPVILKIVGSFSYELITVVLLVLIVQSFISCAYFLTVFFLLLPSFCGIKIGSAY